MPRIIGIDFGTTSSVVSVMREGKIIIIPSAEGERFTPSFIGYDPDKQKILVGAEARKRAEIHPQETIYSIKRFLGKKYLTREIQQAVQIFPNKIKFHPGGGIGFDLGGKLYTPPQLAGLIIQKIRIDSEIFLGEKIDSAVLTVPAYFSFSQRQALQEAAAFAGLKVLRIINEPTAAALAYCYNKPRDQKLAVVHFGGGTFDISVIHVGDGVFEVMATGGDTLVGGDDLDSRVVEWLCGEVERKENINPRSDLDKYQRLKWVAEKAKRDLSTMQRTEICIPYFISRNGQYTDFRTEMDRTTLESLLSPIVKKISDPCRQTLADACIPASSISTLLLTGQQTRMPLVQQFVQETFGMIPRRDVDPAEIVAMGAAVQAAVLDGVVRDVLLLDVTPLTLSVETQGRIATPIIQRNTTIPTRKSEMFTTTLDNQTAVDIRVLQGTRPLSTDNVILGVIRLDGISQAPKGIPQIEVCFDIDANGILKITATDKATARSRSVNIIPPDEELFVYASPPKIEEKPESKTEAPHFKIPDIENQIGSMEKRWRRIRSAMPAEWDNLFTHKIQNTRDELKNYKKEQIISSSLRELENILVFGKSFLLGGLKCAIVNPFIEDVFRESDPGMNQMYIAAMKALDENGFSEKILDQLTRARSGKEIKNIRKLIQSFPGVRTSEILKPQTVKEKLLGKRKWANPKYGKE